MPKGFPTRQLQARADRPPTDERLAIMTKSLQHTTGAIENLHRLLDETQDNQQSRGGRHAGQPHE